MNRGKLLSNTSYEKLSQYWEEFGVEKTLLFPQPNPSGLPKYLIEGALFPFGSGLGRSIGNKLFNLEVDYSRAHREISALEDERVEFIPFVNSRLEGIEGIKAKGVKFYEPLGRLPRELLRFLNRRGMNLIVHLSEETQSRPQRFLEAVGDSPHINFQVAHCAEGSEKIVRALERLPNLYFDTSACSLEAYSRAFRAQGTSFREIVEQNPEKILFGSDEPWSSYRCQVEHLEALDLSKKDRERVFYSNFSRVWS